MQRLIRTPALLLLLSFSACSCGDTGAIGDPCDPGASEACEMGLACLPDEAGENTCLVPVGGACGLEDETPFCQAGAGCFPMEGAVEGDPGVCLLKKGSDCMAGQDDSCAPGLECAELSSGAHRCFERFVLRGHVIDSADLTGIEGAHVLAFDDELQALTDVAISGPMGAYELGVPVVRDDQGKPQSSLITLRGSAADYQTFPGGIRTAIPIDTGTAELDMMSTYVIENALTEIALVALPADQAGNRSISGSISASIKAGVLVVAETGGTGHTAVSDRSGAFTIFNVPPGSYTVKGYAADVQLDPAMVEMMSADVTGVVLSESSSGLATVTGSVKFPNTPGGGKTSIVLVVRSTFNPDLVKGEVPLGLRAPKSGPPNVSGDFSITGVPAGEYYVLAAFENDGLVQDPDQNISGTDLVTITVPARAETVPLSMSFNITQALEVFGPGAKMQEAVTSPPMLRWADDMSEAYYTVKVVNALGDAVWEEQHGPVSGSDTVSVQYGGPLEAGMYYQFRAMSWRAPGGQNDSPISATEDLRGVFFKPVQ